MRYFLLDSFPVSEIEYSCPGISRDMVRDVLRQMKDEKIIESSEKDRGAKWVNV